MKMAGARPAWTKQKKGDEVLGGFVSLNRGGVRILLQRLVQHEVDLVVAQGLLEVGDVGILVNLDILDAQHLGKVLPVLLVDVVGEGRVVSAAGENPGCSANLERGLRNPECRGDGQLGHGLRLDALYLLRDEAEAVAQVDDSGLDAATGLRGEDEACRLLFADADAEEVNFELGFVGSDEGADLEHVAL